MDAYLFDSTIYSCPGEIPLCQGYICHNIPFYWDGTGEVWVRAKNIWTGAPENFLYSGQGRFEGENWYSYLSWLPHDGWRATSVMLAGPGSTLIHTGLNYISLYMQGWWGYEWGTQGRVWITGPGITPGNRLDIGRPLFQFQIGIEPPGT